MKTPEKILCDIGDRLAILELACMSLGNKEVLRIRENLIDASDYGYALDEYCLKSQCNVSESSEKKGA